MKKILHIALFYLVLNSPVYAQYAWSNMGLGTNFTVQALEADSTQNILYVGGIFSQAGPIPMVGIAKWDGANYSGLGQGVMVGSGISSLHLDNGVLYAGGTFTNMDGVPTKNIAGWNGLTWSPLGLGLDTIGATTVIKALATYNNELYAGGYFSRSGATFLSYIAKWDGANWLPVGGGTNGVVSSLCVYNNELYVGGTFTQAGGQAVNNIAKWDGNNWTDVGGGVSYTGAISVSALQVFGGDLIAGGTFDQAGSVPVRHIARWNGVNWGDVGGGAAYTGAISVSALEVFKGDLVAGGSFDTLGTVSSKFVGKWDGVNWSAMGTGMNNSVLALQTLHDTLYAGGYFTMADGNTSLFVSQWKPTAVSSSGLGVSYHDQSYFRLYPNPVINELHIDGNSLNNHTLTFTLLDQMGREIMKKENVLDRVDLSSENIAPGLYIYKLSGGDKRVLQEGKLIFTK